METKPLSSAGGPAGLPAWVPGDAGVYLRHVQTGQSIRKIALGLQLHASTLARRIARLEARRDDPLVDAALAGLARCMAPPQGGDEMTETTKMSATPGSDITAMDNAVFEREALRVLRRLCETGAVLAVAADMEKSVVVRETDASGSTRTAVVEASVAQAMALKDWIACRAPGRISRYAITPAGRAALNRLLAQAENRASGFAEAQSPFAGQHRAWGDKTVAGDGGGKPRRVRFNMAESPLTLLARRKDKSGRPFLGDDLVAAGERLREDFELAQMGPRVAQNWDKFLTGGDRGGFGPDSGVGNGPEAARARVHGALSALGEGLGDVALRCCCYLEGLEAAEKRLGWSARSGKIVLRIALIRLREHYRNSKAGQMIG